MLALAVTVPDGVDEVLEALPISAEPSMYSRPKVDPCANVYSAKIAPISSDPVFVIAVDVFEVGSAPAPTVVSVPVVEKSIEL